MGKVRNFALFVTIIFGTTLQAQTVSKTAPIEFVGAAQPMARLRVDRAVVYDGAGKALFTGDEDFIRAYAHNLTGRVQAWDMTRSRVLLSSTAHQAWLNCADLEPMALACTDIVIATSATGLIQVSKGRPAIVRGGSTSDLFGTPAAIAIPNCPGSKLCPKP